MHGRMVAPQPLMLVAYTLYFAAVDLIRLRADQLRRERNAAWIREVLS
jgi:hypothetical protein